LKQKIASFWNEINPDIAALGLVLLGLTRRVSGLGERPLWFDEAISAVYARQDIPTLFALNNGDNHPFGYYLTLKFWIDLFGYNDTTLRLLSVVPGVGAIWLVWLIGRHLFPEQPIIALVATSITALNPFQIYFSQEARNYSFMQFWVLLAIWFWLRGLENSRWLDWVGLGVISALAIIYNFTGAFYLAALYLYPLFRAKFYWEKGILLRMWGAGAGGGVVAGVALLPKLTSRLDAIKNNFWIPEPEPLIVLRTFFTFIFGAAPADLFLLAFALAFVLLAITLGMAIPAWWRERRDSGLARALWLLFAPIGLVILVSLVFQSLYLDKALIACSPFYYLLLGWVIFKPGTQKWGGAILVGIPLVIALLWSSLYIPDIYNGKLQPLYIARYNANQINTYLAQQPAEAVLTATDIAWLPLVYYGAQALPPKYSLSDYPTPNIFPLLVEKLHSETISSANVGKRFKRFWVLFELYQGDNPITKPRPLPIGEEIPWAHSKDWQVSLMADFDSKYTRVQAVELDRVLLVLYQQ